MKLVARSLPLNLTTEELTKLLPLRDRTKAASPRVAEACERLLSVGTGLFTMKLTALEAPPPGAGLMTTIVKVPAAAMSAAEISAVNCEPLMKLVLRLLPLNCTTEPLTKLLPLTVSVNAASPTTALAVERLLMVGAGLLTVKLKALELPPPGAGLITVTGTTPAAAMSAAVMSAVRCVLLTKWVTRYGVLNFTTE